MMDVKRSIYSKKLKRLQPFLNGKLINSEHIIPVLEQIIFPGDKVCLEGNNQKQADFLANSLCQVNPKQVYGLHLLQSAVSLPAHLDVFELGIAQRLDFSYAGAQSTRLAIMLQNKKVKIGNIHTYNELYSRYLVDLTPDVALISAEKADREGNLFTGANTEETPAIVEATAFKSGVVIAQVNEIVNCLPRVDIPGSWVNGIIKSPNPAYLTPLFTRDPALIDETRILMAMMTIKGIYGPYRVNRLNHGVGFNTCAIELLLPTYAKELGFKDKICQHWVLNPLPTLIPAIEAGFVNSIFCFGGEVGMEDYVRKRSEVFFIGREGHLRSNRLFAQTAGHYALDAFVGSTLQIDIEGNSSTATKGRVAGFGGAPNLGCDPRGRRHVSPTWIKAGKEVALAQGIRLICGRKLVVQLVKTFQGGKPTFVEKLDAWEMMEVIGTELPPIMIYGEDVSHIVTEEGIANLLLCKNKQEKEEAIRAVAGATEVGLARNGEKVEQLRERGIVQYPEDLNIALSDVNRDLLAARTIEDLVIASKGLYKPPVLHNA